MSLDAVYAPDARRSRRDSCWAIAFALTTCATLGVGLASSFTSPSKAPTSLDTWTALRTGAACFDADGGYEVVLAANRARIASETRLTASLGFGAGKGHGFRSTLAHDAGMSPAGALGATTGDSKGAIDGKTFLHKAWPWVVVAFGGAFLLGSFLMTLLKYHARSVVWGVMYLKISVLAVLTVLTAIAGQLTGSLLCALGTLLAMLTTYLWRGELDIVASMISVSTQGLRDNPHLVSVTVILQVLAMAYLIPVVYLMADATQHGEATINKYAVESGTDVCLGYYSQTVDCCRWEMQSWVVSYLTLGLVSGLWVVATALEARLYIIGGTVCQWYFAPAGTTDFKGTTSRSLKHAFGPSFGTICYGSFVITMIELLKRSAEKMRRENRGNILVCLCTVCLDCVYAIIEYISRFAMIQASMTGEAFCDAARTITDLLSRNFLLAYGTYAFPRYILTAVVFILSVAFGYLAYAMSSVGYSFSEGVYIGSAYANAVGIMCFIIAYVVLNFSVMILLNVVDSIFVCYAIDKDRNAVHHPDLHSVFAEVNEKQTRAQEEADDERADAPLFKANTNKAVYASM
jgi:hypothetical protein